VDFLIPKPKATRSNRVGDATQMGMLAQARQPRFKQLQSSERLGLSSQRGSRAQATP